MIGTIALLDIGHNMGALRDVFVHETFRGQGFSKKLLDTVIEWARNKNIDIIYLGTTLVFKAAHRFYEKHGFIEIPKGPLPSNFPIMKVDKKFYKLKI